MPAVRCGGGSAGAAWAACPHPPQAPAGLSSRAPKALGPLLWSGAWAPRLVRQRWEASLQSQGVQPSGRAEGPQRAGGPCLKPLGETGRRRVRERRPVQEAAARRRPMPPHPCCLGWRGSPAPEPTPHRPERGEGKSLGRGARACGPRGATRGGSVCNRVASVHLVRWSPATGAPIRIYRKQTNTSTDQASQQQRRLSIRLIT